MDRVHSNPDLEDMPSNSPEHYVARLSSRSLLRASSDDGVDNFFLRRNMNSLIEEEDDDLEESMSSEIDELFLRPSPKSRAPSRKAQSLMDQLHNSASSLEGNHPHAPLNGGNNGGNNGSKRKLRSSRIFDDAKITEGYKQVPFLDTDELPRGGISIETAACGRIQFGIPPETIKDSMILGLEVPSVYIIPTERLCTDFGPALGINLAECEFPAYFNYFVRQKKCVLVVDSPKAEKAIRSVFEETLIGPRQFRDKQNYVPNEDEDFGSDYPKDARPNFFNEFTHFRTAEKTKDYDELCVDMLLDFCHFIQRQSGDVSDVYEKIGVPPKPKTAHSLFAPSSLLGGDFDYDSESSSESDSEINLFDMNASFAHFGKTSSFSPRRNKNKSKRIGILSHNMKNPQKTNLNPYLNSRQHKIKSGSPRRGSLETISSCSMSNSSSGLDTTRGGSESTAATIREKSTPADTSSLMYSQVQWLGELATVWPRNATAKQIEERSVPRVEIFKMPGGIEYVIHDVDENNVIVGKARFKGAVDVPDEIAVEGFLGPSNNNTELEEAKLHSIRSSLAGQGKNTLYKAPSNLPPTFHPPSFGVTVLGNSHGFDKNGSTSGYVLWINGRGIMIDPPPFSSATLEREGIRPQMIFGVLITHCHADHDAGAFQKILTGSRVTFITTPTIYKSFIRKYSAISGLNEDLLKGSHRYRPAIIGSPLSFQGATFHFTYSFHTIPSIAFKAEWRGRSMVFTGDHLNLPPLFDKLEASGVMTKGRADSMRNLPLQECDILLHEAGAPPIHTPLDVLKKLPDEIKARMYVVHTSALPDDCGLRVAPTGTAGTIRLDEINTTGLRPFEANSKMSGEKGSDDEQYPEDSPEIDGNANLNGLDGLSLHGVSFHNGNKAGTNLCANEIVFNRPPPPILFRPKCISDAWFMMNLLSNIPFFSSLSYMNAMAVLDIANIELFRIGETVVPASKRIGTVCLIWEGACVESIPNQKLENGRSPTVWYAGDWSGPLVLQPNLKLSSEPSLTSSPGDIVALSENGVKSITLPMKDLEKILWQGSNLYRKYLKLQKKLLCMGDVGDTSAASFDSDASDDFTHSQPQHVLETLKLNSVLSSIQANQLRYLESIAEGPQSFKAGSYLWKVGDPCDNAYLIATGTAQFCGQKIDFRRAFSMRKGADLSSRNFVETNAGNIVEVDKVLKDLPPHGDFAHLKEMLSDRVRQMELGLKPANKEREVFQTRSINKILARLYTGKKCIEGLQLGRGCFLNDTTRMVSVEILQEDEENAAEHRHSSNLIAGDTGCIVWVFPRSELLSFFYGNPGVLLPLLGKQAVV